MFAKVRRRDILSRRMEADMFAKVNGVGILSRSMEADMFAKLKMIDILSRGMEADMFAKVNGVDILSRSMETDIYRVNILSIIGEVYKILVLFIDFVVSIGVATYSIVMNVALVIKTAE